MGQSRTACNLSIQASSTPDRTKANRIASCHRTSDLSAWSMLTKVSRSSIAAMALIDATPLNLTTAKSTIPSSDEPCSRSGVRCTNRSKPALLIIRRRFATKTVFAEWVADRHQGKSEHIAGQAQNRPDFILIQNVVRRDQGSEAERPARQNDVLYGWIDARASNLRLIGQMGLVALRYRLWQRVTRRHIARSQAGHEQNRCFSDVLPKVFPARHKPPVLLVRQMGWATAGGINFSDLVRSFAIDRAQAPALRLVTHDDKDPVLSVAARGSPDGGVENACDQFVRNWVRLQPAQCAGGVHGIEEADFRHVRDVLEATTWGSEPLSFAGFVGNQNRNLAMESPRRSSLDNQPL